MTKLLIDGNDPRKYMQIACNLEGQITTGVLESGDIVTVAELSTDFKVTRQTARRALKVIEGERLVTACGTAGFMVTNGRERKINSDEVKAAELTDKIAQSLDNFAEASLRLKDAVLRLDATTTKLAEYINREDAEFKAGQ